MLESLTTFLTTQLGFSIALSLAIIGVLLGCVAYSIYYERKIASWTQDRYGPNRCGPLGIFQPAADGGKFFLKEDVIPNHVEKFLFVLAPGIMYVLGFIGFAVIPWGGQWEVGGHLLNVQVVSIDIGLLYILACGSLAVYGIVLGGYASNNKYSFQGAVRATAQMLSYEIPLGLCILVIVLTAGSLRLETIGQSQAQTELWFGFVPQWNIFLHPLAAIVLFIAGLAEANRTPFDICEGEQELVGGYHTEYSALKFGMFFLAEYAQMITASAMLVVLFFGGWHFPWLHWTQAECTTLVGVLAKFGVILGKSLLLVGLMMWIRWTLPRFRWDQLMRVAWKAMIPMTLALFVGTVILLYFGWHKTIAATALNVGVLIVALAFAATSRNEVTGRGANMPEIKPDGTAGPSMGVTA